MNETIQAALDRSVLCWLATVSADGVPNVSPKEIFAGFGRNAIVIADIASPVSVRNLRQNPKVCVSFIDVFRQRGFKAKGMARVIAPDEGDFRNYGAELLDKAGGEFPIHHVILVNLQQVARIKAPSYRFYPDRSEDEIMRAAHRTYGVQPAA